MAHHILVVGGNGFLGSAVCKAAIAKSWCVTSISKSGQPYITPSGHTPAWASQVAWNAASADQPDTYSSLLHEVTAIVYTPGILLEAGYKSGIAGALNALWSSRNPNPLKQGGPGSYEAINRDYALIVLDAVSRAPSSTRRAFAYISAADIFRPLIPERYISTKREAERAIQHVCLNDESHLRGLYFRPGLMYHPHLRPLTTPIASLLEISASIHSSAPGILPTPARMLRSLPLSGMTDLPPPTHAMANALETRPMHVESVARAVCAGIEMENISGIVDVDRMRELIGWDIRKDSMAFKGASDTAVHV